MLSIVMLHYGAEQVDMTVKCLAQLKASTVGDFEILLWINGDANAEYNHPLIESHDLVRGTDERLGLAAAYNRAVHHLRGDLFCVIHNDCFVNPGWNKSLEEEALRGNIAFPIVTTNAGFLAVRGMSEAPEWMPPACCFVIGKDELEVLGGWDERFEFCHFEDMDLFKRATEKGMRLVQCPEKVFHLRGVTRVHESTLANEAFKKNELRYARKHGVRDGARIVFDYPRLELLGAEEHNNVDLH